VTERGQERQRTYWHLESLGRKPSEYEIATSRLLYYVERGFEIASPLAPWYERHQTRARWRAADWEAFADPRETTYTRYVEIQKKRELFVDGLFQSMEDTGYDRSLAPAWVQVLSGIVGPLRHAVHGLQMLAAYVGQMAPSGRIVVTALFQAADEIRRVQRLAYRMRALQDVDPTFGADARERWQSDPVWQPLRAVLERLLVTYDWDEAFVALNVVLKPAFDDLFMVQVGRLAQARGDDRFARVLLSLNEDCEWHRTWTAALVQTALAQEPANRAPLEGWIDRWSPPVHEAMDALLPIFDTPAGSEASGPARPSGRLRIGAHAPVKTSRLGWQGPAGRYFLQMSASLHFTTLLLTSALAAAPRATPRPVPSAVASWSGCYTLAFSDWSTPVTSEDVDWFMPPKLVELSRQPNTTEPDSYRVLPDRDPALDENSHIAFAYWKIRTADSVTFVWSDGFMGLTVPLVRYGGTLRGRTEVFSDGGPSELYVTLTATRTSCIAPRPSKR
jgi:toluene monooxygenase system protein E